MNTYTLAESIITLSIAQGRLDETNSVAVLRRAVKVANELFGISEIDFFTKQREDNGLDMEAYRIFNQI